jgi:predicted nucleotidyltransferase
MAKKRIPEKINKTARGYAVRLSKQKKLSIKKVIIFGSYVKGGQRKWSDIDVCIISPKFTDNIGTLDYLWRFRNDEEVRIGLEPVGFSVEDFKKGGPLIREITKTGIEIKINNK